MVDKILTYLLTHAKDKTQWVVIGLAYNMITFYRAHKTWQIANFS